MFRRFRNFIGLNSKGAAAVTPTRRLIDAGSVHRGAAVNPGMFELAQEVGVYIHRFHNLDLFQQGWYQIKITMRWEDGEHRSPGTPARVVQYEAPDLGSDDIYTIWRISDIDHSFSTQPFRIKYARQDVHLSVMISFNLALDLDESSSASAVILKFELHYAPISEDISELQASLDSSTAAVHELRVPPKALLGLHSYCPLHFDAFHAVLVDMSMHTVLLKAGTSVTPQKLISDHQINEIFAVAEYGEHYQASGGGLSLGRTELKCVKALYDSRNILLEELEKLSKIFDYAIDDLVDVPSGMSWNQMISYPSQRHSNTLDSGSMKERNEGRQDENESNSLQNVSGRNDLGANAVVMKSLSSEELLDAFHCLGYQLSLIWNAFLKFHRMNRAKIVEYLREVWSNDRRAEWSIWMINSTVETPSHKIKNGVEASHYAVLGKVNVLRKAGDDPLQNVISRAELHRRTIAQMKINNRSIQDMYIFGDPSHVPVIAVEQHKIKSLDKGVTGSLLINNAELKDNSDSHARPVSKHVWKSVGTGRRRNGRQLSFVVFVHGFQGHHLDLRLVRNQWLLIDPGAECLMSEVNEDRTTGDFREMGERLAEEVARFLKKKMEARSGTYKCVKLSFVGHSIGNLILRSAITEPVMEPYLKYLHTYMSISGPHLGYLYSSNTLFNSGLWLLKKLKGAHCIHQLTFSDDADMHNTFLYKLCKKTLENFKNIILLSSPQDGYVPYHSARIEFCQAATSDSKRGSIFSEMLNSCLDQINAPSIEPRTFMRCDVNFDTSTQGRSLNTIIGRAAHIEFLETDVFAKFIMWSFTELFT
ncbi:uncharacterized protein LOC116258892 isoform X2 [Nymphaea colorata]|uniref:uncharacterized protein LOC116258892 isoform X2 n=1 Tax=Nymphaea colorata TaxID=210225 RepID=UPI00129E3A21|nr:uncharacterized protein LOC116258892 isoform X2 [Nymphaea colorata]